MYAGKYNVNRASQKKTMHLKIYKWKILLSLNVECLIRFKAAHLQSNQKIMWKWNT